MLVIHNTSKPDSILKKKCNEIAYYAIHKSLAMGESLTKHMRSEDNPDDLLTKVVTGQKRKHLVSLVLYAIYDGDTYQRARNSFPLLAKLFHELILECV